MFCFVLFCNCRKEISEQNAKRKTKVEELQTTLQTLQHEETMLKKSLEECEHQIKEPDAQSTHITTRKQEIADIQKNMQNQIHVENEVKNHEMCCGVVVGNVYGND